MGNKDKASNKTQDIKGRVKEKVGSATGNAELESKGKTDQSKASMKDAGEKIKDAASKVKDSLTKK
ncbi:MAG: CsbD family protein [Acidimicrobiales bacterium]